MFIEKYVFACKAFYTRAYSPNLKLTVMKPICVSGASESGCHLYFLAVAKAGSTKHGFVLVVPLVYLAAMTFPLRFTVIWTTTVPNSLHF
jgi:hypothetical protein